MPILFFQQNYWVRMNGQNQIDRPQAPVVSISEWLVTSLIMMIPLVNLIMMLVWAFSSNTNPNKANYFKAALILFAIVMVIYLVLAVVFFGSVAANQ